MLVQTARQLKRLMVAIVGFTLLLFGVVMLVTPGPGWLMIGIALSVLAIEFAWAKTLLDKIRERGTNLKDAIVRARRPANRDTRQPVADKSSA